ncbi:MAG: carbohydrate ABC transporter permease [Cetobacterium sp.]
MKTRGEKIFDLFNIIFMIIFSFVIIYPIWYIVVLSLNDAQDAIRGGIYWIPRKFSFDNYIAVFQNKEIFTAFGVTILKTSLGIITHVLFTAMVAYGISKQELKFRKFYIILGTITLFFSGGLIPYYILIKDIGLIDNFLVYIIPSMFSFYNLILFQSFFRDIPASIEESASIDGANHFQIFTRIILPISLPIIATVSLFVGVGQWNDFFTGLLYVNTPELQPIQTLLYKIIAKEGSSVITEGMRTAGVTLSTTSKSLQLATMVITTLPVVCLYPFLQKYFVKGMVLGSVKE